MNKLNVVRKGMEDNLVMSGPFVLLLPVYMYLLLVSYNHVQGSLNFAMVSLALA